MQLPAGVITGRPVVETSLKVLVERCGCTTLESGVCERRLITTPAQDATTNASIFARGCTQVISTDVLSDLQSKQWKEVFLT